MLRGVFSPYIHRLMKKHCFINASIILAGIFALGIHLSISEEKISGYVQILDGKDLAAWDGDSDFWKLEDGILIGETTATHQLKHSSYILWKKRKLQNFELKLEFRLQGGNSGVQYRSLEGEGERWTTVKGYQADLDATDKYTGILYEVGMRKFLALRGQKVVVDKDGKSKVAGSVKNAETIKNKILREGWNEYHIIARGTRLVHIINGQVMVDVQDNGPERIQSGYIGFQLHQGPPMKIEFKNIRLKEYPRKPPE